MSKIQSPDKSNFSAYCGYDQSWEGSPNTVLTQTDPRTPCGEFLRRYWHPIYIADELKDLPKLIKILGEELVLFRDGSGEYGLVHKRCPHRRASLEYGHPEQHGIRCCYHGWLFDVDGTILQIPGEPSDSQAAANTKKNLRLGAYPVIEYKGLLFAYLGPAQERPEFPIYDTFNIPDMTMVPYKVHFKCNWIQVLDAIVDPVHTAFLHQSQFSDGFGTMGELEFYQRDKCRVLGTATRRVGENVWVRVNELILPNFTQAGSAFAADGTQVRHFGRSAFTRWVVPMDDENCMVYAWANFGERGDPHEWNTPEGVQLIEQGELVDRSHEQRQRSPGDVEAVESMGAISDHEKEYFVPGDRGVGIYRSRLRKYISNLQKGVNPPQPTDLSEGSIPTYGSDTILQVPQNSDQDDAAVLRSVNAQVMDILFNHDSLNGDHRDDEIITTIKKLSPDQFAQ